MQVHTGQQRSQGKGIARPHTPPPSSPSARAAASLQGPRPTWSSAQLTTTIEAVLSDEVVDARALVSLLLFFDAGDMGEGGEGGEAEEGEKTATWRRLLKSGLYAPLKVGAWPPVTQLLAQPPPPMLQLLELCRWLSVGVLHRSRLASSPPPVP